MHTCRCRAINTRARIHQYAHTRGDGLPTTADGAADVRVCACVCAHLGIRTFLEAQASMQAHTVRMGIPHPRARAHAHMRTLPWSRFAHSYTDIYMHSYIRTQMCVRSGTRLVGARVRRSRRALARTHAHAHTLAWNLHAHICMYMHSHI